MANMRRQGQYSDAGINPALAAQMQRTSAYRAQHSPGASRFAGRLDPVSGEDEHQYMTSKEGHWQWDRDGQRGASSLPSSHGFGEGQRLDSKASSEKLVHADRRSQAQEQDMDIGYLDNSLPRTFDGLERKFLDDITKLTNEHQDAEDAENARHRERLIEINAQYQEKLFALRSGQAAQRESFLREESQACYQQARLNSYPGSGPLDPCAFGLAGTAVDTVGDGNRPHGGSQLNFYRERSHFGGGRDRGLDSRAPYPGGRAYGANIRHY